MSTNALPFSSTLARERVPEEVELLRRDRDRFVSFAFCGADVLLELDRSGAVLFAAGATQNLMDCPADTLQGRLFGDIIAAVDAAAANKMLDGLRRGIRSEDTVLRLGASGGRGQLASFNGFSLGDEDGRIYLSLRAASDDLGVPLDRSEAGGALKRESFAAVAARAAVSAKNSGRECQLTLFDIGQIEELRQRLDARTSAEIAERTGATLREASLGGDVAGKFNESHYGLLHGTDVDLDSLRAQIEAYSRESDPSGRGIKLDHATLSMDTLNLSEKETARAILYAINTYCDSVEGGFTIKSLSESLRDLAQDSIARVDLYARMIDERQFVLAFQPICGLGDRQPHHFEALMRSRMPGVGSDPYTFVTFAEEVGLICDLDFAVVSEVLKKLKALSGHGYKYYIAANLSGRSLSTPMFTERLLGLLKADPEISEGLVFEVTESAKIGNLHEVNKIVQELRRAGHSVCLDDFGAGEAAFQYLGALEVDVVKLDGAYIHKALISRRGKAVLKAMASMCSELSITAVAEMIETEEHLNLVRDCGIGFGQGYHLGAPNTDLSAFDAPRPVMLIGQHKKPRSDGGPHGREK